MKDLEWQYSPCGECLRCHARQRWQHEINDVDALTQPRIDRLTREREADYHRWPKHFDSKRLEHVLRQWRALRKDLVDDILRQTRSIERCDRPYILVEVWP